MKNRACYCYIIRSNGYSLLELSIVLVIIGLITVAAITGLRLYFAEKRDQLTIEHLNVVTQSINDFRKRNGRFPCPASFNFDDKDSEFGTEYACVSGGVSPACDEGACQVAAQRQLDEILPQEPSPFLSNSLSDSEGESLRQRVKASTYIRLGAVPVRALGLDDKYMFDGYDGYYLYAVTENLALKTPEHIESGAIQIIDSNGDRLMKGRGHAAFLVLSHGENVNGAYAKLGNGNANICSPEYLDFQNCDHNDPVFLSDEKGDNYDDYLSYGYTTAKPKWQAMYNKRGDLFLKKAETSSVGIGNVAIA